MSAHHGNTPAAWTGVVLAMLGFVIAGVGLLLTPISMLLFWVGTVFALVALPVFAVLAKMGLHS